MPGTRSAAPNSRWRTSLLPTSIWLLAGLVCTGCEDESTASSAGGGGAQCEGGGAAGGGAPGGITLPALSKGRLLRRVSLVLRNEPPSAAEFDEVLAAADDAAAQAVIDAKVEQWLGDPAFYRRSFEFARDWMHFPIPERAAEAGSWHLPQVRGIERCLPGTSNAGAYAYGAGHWGGGSGDVADACANANNGIDLEPWWADGTTVRLVGRAANTALSAQVGNVTIDCRAPTLEAYSGDQPCGCGPHALMCMPGPVDPTPGSPNAGNESLAERVNGAFDEKSYRRLAWEEPYRLFAHLVYNDRPVTDLLTADVSVAPLELQAVYVRMGILGGVKSLWDSDFYKAANFARGGVDPEHGASDRDGWHEYKPSERYPLFLADREYHFDPRTEAGPMLGFPSAGALTTFGFIYAYPRERLRAARALETFGCEVFSPPSGDLQFNTYERDPAREGSCQHCHTRIDAGAIHFKRFAHYGGYGAIYGWGGSFRFAGVGADAAMPAGWETAQYPFTGFPYQQWLNWYEPNTFMTPVTEAQAAENPYVRFIDFLPPDVSLVGEKSDGTVGPLGFAKLITQGGAFDRCFVRQTHRMVFGTDIDLATESGYLQAWTERFQSGGRNFRALIREMMASPHFRGGL